MLSGLLASVLSFDFVSNKNKNFRRDPVLQMLEGL